MGNRHVLYFAALELCLTAGGLAQAGPSPRANNERSVPSREPGKSETARSAEAASRLPASLASKTRAQRAHAPNVQQDRDPNCRAWKGEACTVCGIDAALNISVKNKTKTPLLRCRDMKPGPARVVMVTHAEPAISGLWEVEFGLGYQTSIRNECPHQFIASNSPPLKAAYEIGPISIETEIPPDGSIETLVCVGLSSARASEEAKETGASLKISTLRIVSE